MSRKKRLLINIDYDFAEGDVFEEAVLEKRRIAKLMQSLKETTGSIVDIQIKLDDRRGEKTSDLSKMKFRRNQMAGVLTIVEDPHVLPSFWSKFYAKMYKVFKNDGQ